MAAKKRKKKGSASFKQGCANSIERNPRTKFSKSCAKRYPELVGGEPRKKVPKKAPKVCNDLLSKEMKAGHRKTAFRKYWSCRREHAA